MNMTAKELTHLVCIEVAQRVERLGSSKDYCTGRRGMVIEINKENGRIRVSWDTERSGETMRPIRTWVNMKFLKPIF